MKNLYIYEILKQKVDELGIVCKLYSDFILLYSKDGELIGKFLSIYVAYHYVCGYEIGLNYHHLSNEPKPVKRKEWQGLTQQECEEILHTMPSGLHNPRTYTQTYAELIEAKLKEKNI